MNGLLATAVLVAIAGPLPVCAQEPDDPALRAAVGRFFAAQVAEDIDAYLALWSSTAQRPSLEMLKFVFESGDDTRSCCQECRKPGPRRATPTPCWMRVK